MDRTQTHILGAKIDLYKKGQIPGLLSVWLNSKRLHHIVTLNPEIALYAESDEKYRRSVLNKSDLTVRDGVGLMLGAFLLGTKVPPRITGRQLMSFLLTAAQKQNKKIYLLGGQGDTAKRAADQLKKRYPHLQIVGAESGPTKEHFSYHDPALIDRINRSGAEILFVAFGAPKQELWIAKNKELLSTIKIAAGIGGIFDYLSGNVAMPPKWMQSMGLEWFYRLVTQKGRARRVFQAVVVFPLLCLTWRLRIIFVFRKNVVGVIRNRENKFLLVTPSWSRVHKWQFPQGGVDRGEDPDDAILREMQEELGTDTFEIQSAKPDSYRYVWPKWYQLLRGYKGQKQDIYYLRFTGSNNDIDTEQENELAAWKWVSQRQLISTLSPARKQIGEIVLKHLR